MPTLREISNTLEKIKARARTLEKAVAEKVAAKKAKAHPVVAPPTTYTGPSVVDYLKSAGQPSSFTSREKLAAQHGITDYRGTAKQNIRHLTPIAEDIYSLFGLGEKNGLSPADLGGLALVGIQYLLNKSKLCQ